MGTGWNITQSKIAIGSGKIFGKGFLNNTQGKLKYLPESHTDFIGSVFLEERGFIGGSMLLLILYSSFSSNSLYLQIQLKINLENMSVMEWQLSSSSIYL